MYQYFKKIGNTEHVSSWKSKGLFDKIIKPVNTPVNSFALTLTYTGDKIRVKFDGICSQQERITITHE